MNKQQRAMPTALVQYIENALAAVRTAGALLVGNAALIYFGVVGQQPGRFVQVLLVGTGLFLSAAIPVAILQRDQLAKAALKSNQPKGD